MVYHVGRPAIFEGNRFLPLTGMPILKIARIRVLLAVWLPEPFTVAATIAKSFTIGGRSSMLTCCASVWGSVTLIFLTPNGCERRVKGCRGAASNARPAHRHPQTAGRHGRS